MLEAMKRFDFRFQAVLDARQQALEDATRVLVAKQEKHAFAVDLLTQRRQALATVVAQGAVPGHQVNPSQLVLRQRYAARLRVEIDRRVQQLGLIDKEVETARQAVTVAHQEVRALEILLERDREAWRQAWLKEEQAQLDETNTQRFGRH
jgi:flagellar export protein FliJ